MKEHFDMVIFLASIFAVSIITLCPLLLTLSFFNSENKQQGSTEEGLPYPYTIYYINGAMCIRVKDPDGHWGSCDFSGWDWHGVPRGEMKNEHQ